MKLTGAEITIKLLERCGVKVIAGIPGGTNLPLYDSLFNSSIKHILARHEQGAAFIAQGIARSTGKAAVCFATSGPGATNLLTAIADAKLDSVPIIAVTGQVPYSYVGTDSFQEVDIYGLTIPITKHNFFVRSVEELFKVIPEAFRISESGRQGPVLVDIPKNIQNEEFEFEQWPVIENYEEKHEFDNSLVSKAAKIINEAKRPILYIGGGITNSNSGKALYDFAKKNNIPVTSTLMGLGNFPIEDPLFMGMLGMHGARYTNLLLNKADLLLAFGVRFDDRAIGNVNKFCPDAKIIHVDIDDAEIDKIKKSYLSICGNVGTVLNDLIPLLEEEKREDWIDYIESIKKEKPMVFPDETDCFHPINIIKTVSKLVRKDTIITTDVGQHQMWTAQAYPINAPRTFLTSGGLGTMGFGLPTAIGAAVANPDKQVVCFSGDGSFLMNIQELATLADLDLNVKIIILNNGHLGLVRQQQQLFYNEHYMASRFSTSPDFAKISEGFGIKGYSIDENSENPLEVLKEVLSNKGPCLINIAIDKFENVFPMVQPGCGISEMIGGE
ncbi:biosynthetic-type acetolactate synthase large subunit [Clostridium sp.]|jgi:acetolactate synthase-1/2/3 large subunit|uniref:biosynthetic-type acetolactate synthase large subunit n=1 Tax=Clostridium sp. TaxID=1506 RepID=UPI0025886AB2|nr:biosynthetic-type acetolactate synthase large subunit [Clostridium sp.]MDF2505456.1 acetolactate synthase, large subunit, biosynthetic type [Clostridium sp.]